jgi:ABC-type polysaccharide/polyol phosphate export permease
MSVGLGSRGGKAMSVEQGMSVSEMAKVDVENFQKKSLTRLAWQDVAQIVLGWRLWFVLGWNDISQRYRRSLLGPFWITISMGVFVLSIGSVYAYLMKIQVVRYLPFLTVGYILWGFISGVIVDSSSAFSTSEDFMRQVNVSKACLIVRLVFRNLIIFLHNIVIYVFVALYYGIKVGPATLLVLPGLILTVWFVTMLATIISIVATRFRDVQQMVGSIVMLLFFISPVMWDPTSIPPSMHFILDFNPFAWFLDLVRAPLLLDPIVLRVWESALGACVAATFVAWGLFARYRGRVVYWL